MNEKIVFGQYYKSDSWLHKLDPRVKLISVLSLMICLFIVSDIRLLIFFLAFVLIVALSSKVPFMKFLSSIRMMSLVLMITFFLQIIFRKEGNLLIELNFNLTIINLLIIAVVLIIWFLLKKNIKYLKTLSFLCIILALFALQYYFNWGKLITSYSIKVYSNGLKMASYIVLRIITLLFLSALLTLCTKPTELNNGLEYLLKPLKKLNIKTSVFTMMISIALRFIPTLILETDKVLKAQASRGADFKEGKLTERIMQMTSLIVPMFIIAYKRAYDLADAMEARGYIPDKERSSIYLLKYHVSDYLVYIFDLCMLFLVIFFKVTYEI